MWVFRDDAVFQILRRECVGKHKRKNRRERGVLVMLDTRSTAR
jgi:hypothetical protein